MHSVPCECGWVRVRMELGLGCLGVWVFGCFVYLFVWQTHGHVCAGICWYPLRSVAGPEAFSDNECGTQVSVVINLICTAKTSQIHFLCHKFLCSHVHWACSGLMDVRICTQRYVNKQNVMRIPFLALFNGVPI